MIVGEARASGARWLPWSVGWHGGRCFGERWRFRGGTCVPRDNTCPALVKPMASVGVISFLEAPSRVCSSFGLVICIERQRRSDVVSLLEGVVLEANIRQRSFVSL